MNTVKLEAQPEDIQESVRSREEFFVVAVIVEDPSQEEIKGGYGYTSDILAPILMSIRAVSESEAMSMARIYVSLSRASHNPLLRWELFYVAPERLSKSGLVDKLIELDSGEHGI